MKEDLKNIHSMIEKYHPMYPEEHEYKTNMLEFIKSNPDCLLRSCTLGHFTASSLLLNKDMTHICLMLHAKLNMWLQLGGHCDGDADFLNVAIKEAIEESGIKDISPVKTDIFDIDVHLIPANSRESSHYHFDVRFLLRADHDTLIKNHESSELIWVDKNNDLITNNVSRMLKKFRTFQEYIY